MLVLSKFLLTRAHVVRYIIYPICTVLSLYNSYFLPLCITPEFSFVFVLSVANLYLELCGWN